MQKVKNGDEVKVHYTGTLLSGEQFDSSAGRDPLKFTVGAGQMIKGFDAALPGMTVGEKKTITIPSNEAYGEKNDGAIIRFPKKNIPENMKIEKGMNLQLTDESGRPIPVVVADIEEDEVVFDANHSLAGKDLVFDIELMEIS